MANMDSSYSTLDIDVGNSRIKWRLRVERAETRGTVDREHILDAGEWPTASTQSHSRFQRRIAGATLVGSRNGCNHTSEWRPSLRERPSSPPVVTCGYEDPSRLGVDRWLVRSRGPSVVEWLVHRRRSRYRGHVGFCRCSGRAQGRIHRAWSAVDDRSVVWRHSRRTCRLRGVDVARNPERIHRGRSAPRRRVDALRLRQRFDRRFSRHQRGAARSMCAVGTPTRLRRSSMCL